MLVYILFGRREILLELWGGGRGGIQHISILGKRELDLFQLGRGGGRLKNVPACERLHFLSGIALGGNFINIVTSV